MIGTKSIMSLTLPQIETALAQSGTEYEIWPCDEAMADTAAFCAHYGVEPAHSVNAILVQDKSDASNHALCLVTALDRLDVNKTVRKRLGAKKASFATPETTRDVTGMEIGGVTPIGLAPAVPIWIDAKIMALDYIILGGGNRTSKLKVSPHIFETITQVEIIPDLSRPQTTD